jgi:hypothetical protein
MKATYWTRVKTNTDILKPLRCTVTLPVDHVLHVYTTRKTLQHPVAGLLLFSVIPAASADCLIDESVNSIPHAHCLRTTFCRRGTAVLNTAFVTSSSSVKVKRYVISCPMQRELA